MGEFDLTAAEITQLEGEGAAILSASGYQVKLRRPTMAADGTFDGPYETTLTEIGTFAADFTEDPNSEWLMPGVNAQCDLPGAVGVSIKAAGFDTEGGIRKEQPGDQIEITAAPAKFADLVGNKYRVFHAEHKAVAGAATHIKLQLRREYPA